MKIDLKQQVLVAAFAIPGLLLFGAMPSANAGPCTAQIESLEQQIKTSATSAVTGPSGSQTVEAQLHHQPTPNTVEHAEVQANADADAALARARKSDEAGDAAGCQSALTEARRLYGLEK